MDSILREREELEKQSKNLATDLAEKVREMEIAFNEIKYKKTIEITEMSEKLEREYDSRHEREGNLDKHLNNVLNSGSSRPWRGSGTHTRTR